MLSEDAGAGRFASTSSRLGRADAKMRAEKNCEGRRRKRPSDLMEQVLTDMTVAITRLQVLRKIFPHPDGGTCPAGRPSHASLRLIDLRRRLLFLLFETAAQHPSLNAAWLLTWSILAWAFFTPSGPRFLTSASCWQHMLRRLGFVFSSRFWCSIPVGTPRGFWRGAVSLGPSSSSPDHASLQALPAGGTCSAGIDLDLRQGGGHGWQLCTRGACPECGTS